MKIQSLVKFNLLALAQEQKILETITNHNKTLRRYIEQKTILAAYQNRLNESWRNGEKVYAGDARRATKFTAQAASAHQNLIDLIKIKQENIKECELSLVTMQTQRKKLTKRIDAKQKAEESQILKKTEQAIPFYRPHSPSKNSFFSS